MCNPLYRSFLELELFNQLPKVHLWAVSRRARGSSTGRRPGPRQALVGFEHALDIDLAELVGAESGGAGGDGGAKHVAVRGNFLAVATDYAVFLLHLSFDVKGEKTINALYS